MGKLFFTRRISNLTAWCTRDRNHFSVTCVTISSLRNEVSRLTFKDTSRAQSAPADSLAIFAKKMCKTFAALKSHQKSHQTGGGVVLGGVRGLELSPNTVTSTFPHLIFQSETGLPLLNLDSSHKFQVTTINIDTKQLEVEAAAGLEGLKAMEQYLVGLTRAGRDRERLITITITICLFVIV